MVKERLAFEVKSVQGEVPGQSLKVGDIATVDYSGAMQAAYSKPGVFLNPAVFKDLARISNSIHDTRREFYTQDSKLGITKSLSDNEIDRDLFERTRKMELGNIAADFKLRTEAQYAELQQDSLNNNKKFLPRVQVFRDALGREINNVSKDSPYLYEVLNRYANDSMASWQKEALAQDFKMETEKQVYNFKTATGEAAAKMLQDKTSMEDALDIVGKAAGTMMPKVPTANDINLFNSEAYEPLHLLYAQMLRYQVEAGEITLAQGKQAILDVILRNSKQTMTLAHSEETEDGTIEPSDIEVSCYLSPATIQKMLNTVVNADLSKVKGKQEYTLASYYDVTGKKLFAEGNNIFDNPFLVGMDWEESERLFQDVATPLKEAALQGDKNAKKKYEELHEYYTLTVAPAVLSSMVREKSISETGDIRDAIKRLECIKYEVDARLEKGGDALYDPINAAIFGDEDTASYYAPPVLEELPEGEYSKELFRRKQLQSYSKMLERAINDIGNAPNVNKAFAKAKQDLFTSFDVENVIREDTTTHITGVITANEEAFKETANLYTSAFKASSGHLSSPQQTVDLLTHISDQASSLSPMNKRAYFEGVARRLSIGGLDTFWASVPDITQLKSKEKEAYREISGRILLGRYKGGSRYLERFNALLSDPEASLPETFHMNSLIGDAFNSRKAKGSTYTEAREEYINMYVKEPSFKPAARAMIDMMAYTEIAGDKKGNAVFDFKIAEEALQSSFGATGGLYAGVSEQAGISSEDLDAAMAKAQKQLNKSIRDFKMDGTYELTYDAYSNSITVQLNGSAIKAKGVYDPLLGTGMVPINFSLNDKPAGMSTEDFINANVGMAQAVTLNSAMIDNLPEGVPTQVASLINNAAVLPENQKGFLEYLRLGSTGEELAVAPKEYMDEFLKRTNEYPNAFASFFKGIYPLGRLQATFVQGGHTYSPADEAKLDAMLDKEVKEKLVNYMYTKALAGTKADLTFDPTLEALGNKIPVVTIREDFKTFLPGWTITSTTKGAHATNSKHYAGYAFDIDINKSGPLSVSLRDGAGGFEGSKEAQKVLEYFTAKTKSKEIDSVYYSDPAFVSWINGKLKEAGGTPVFKMYKDKKLYKEHEDHMHVELTEKRFDTTTGKDIPIWSVRDYEVARGKLAAVIQKDSKRVGTVSVLTMDDSQRIANMVLSKDYKYTYSDIDSKLVTDGHKGLTPEKIQGSKALQAVALSRRYAFGRQVLQPSYTYFPLFPEARYNIVVYDAKSKTPLQSTLNRLGVKVPFTDKSTKDLTLDQVYDAYNRARAKGLTIQAYPQNVNSLEATRYKETFDSLPKKTIRQGMQDEIKKRFAK